jgi:hypothetical protein
MLEMHARSKQYSLLDRFISYEENEVFSNTIPESQLGITMTKLLTAIKSYQNPTNGDSDQVLYSQHFIFFITYEQVQ